MTMLTEQPQVTQSPLVLTNPLVCRVLPPRTLSRDPVALETAMHSIVLDEHHPLSLEIAGGTSLGQQFIVRSSTEDGFTHAKSQIYARYPQTRCIPLTPQEDPFRLEKGETLSVREMVAGAPSYLPLQSWDEKALEQEGTDPLFGVLAALEKLPEGMRAIAQLTLVPASPAWSRSNFRKAVEHPLEPERARHQMNLAASRAGGGEPSIPALVGLLLLLGCLILYTHVQASIPPWVTSAFLELLGGHLPHLTRSHFLLFWGSIAGIFAGLVLLFITVDQLRRIFSPQQLYDMRLVAQKTGQMAYRVRLRFYVIGPSRPPTPIDGWHRPTFAWIGWRLETLTHNWKEGALLCRQVVATLRWRRQAAQRREAVLARLIAAYRQFHLASGAYFLPKRVTSHKAHLLLSRKRGILGGTHYGWAADVRRSSHYIGVQTLPSLWHMLPPKSLGEIPFLEHRRSRSLPMPPSLVRASHEYLRAQPPGYQRPMGFCDHTDYHMEFAWLREFSSQHTLIGGKSGEGKSTFMEHVAKNAMLSGGLVLLDPHGDLVDKVVSYIPPWRIGDVVLIDLSDLMYAIGLNPLDVKLGRGRDKAIADLIRTLSHIWANSWGPRMEIACEMALKTLMASNQFKVSHDPINGPGAQHTMLDVLPLLTSESYCNSVLEEVNDPYLHRWWREYFEPMSLYMQRDRIDPVLTKMAKFESVIARRILGQSLSTVNFSELIEDGKIILVKLAKGTVGDDVARILGATILGLIQISLEEQGNRRFEQRRQLPILIDEFQVFFGVDYSALAELRKYGAAFFLATQSMEYLYKLDPMLLPTVLANVRQMAIFHMSAQDSRTLYQELGVEEDDILLLDQHMCYVKVTHGNIRQPTFSLTLTLPQGGNEEFVREVYRVCRTRYARPVQEVDIELLAAMLDPHLPKGALASPSTEPGFPFVGASRQPVVIVAQTSTVVSLPPDPGEQEEQENPPVALGNVVEGGIVSETPKDQANPPLGQMGDTFQHPTLLAFGIDDANNVDPALLNKTFSHEENEEKEKDKKYRGRKSERERENKPQAQREGTRSPQSPSNRVTISIEGVSESDLKARGITRTTPPDDSRDANASL